MKTNYLDYVMRGGNHPDKEIDEVERQIAKQAVSEFLTTPQYMQKGLKWTYNWVHFQTLYWTHDPALLKLIYKKKWQPHYLEIEVSTCCNLKCTMCEHTYWCEKNQNMTFDQFKKILDQFPQLKWIGMTGIGESYLNPEYPKMLDYVKKKGIYVENFDNFCFVDEEKSRQMVELGMDKLYVSLDAATKETYEKIRVGANFDKVINNIVTLDKIKREKNSYFPELWFHFIISKDNKHEAVQYLEMIDKLNIDVKRVQYTILLHAYPEIKDKFVEFNDEDKKKVIEKAKELGIQVGFNVNTGDKCAEKNQCTAWTQPFIFVDGTMIQCCSMNEQNDRAWQRKTAIGNVLEKDINEVWKDFKHPSDKCERCILFK
jgi:MoaA/NifB/PqqE/SkfB family radical SAM enzyme